MGRKKLYTDEEIKQKNRERQKQWREKHQEKNRENVKKWREEHPNYLKQQYENNKEYFNEKHKEWVKNNPEKNKEINKKYYEHKKIEILHKARVYNRTPIGRAKYLIKGYKTADKEHNRGECTLTTQWIVDNIFSQSCHYCGETDWHLLGCDRIDNSKPHVHDNVVPCCMNCNRKRGKSKYEDFYIKQKNLDF